MNNFYNKTEFNFDDITALIRDEVEESIHLEFKEANALDKSDGKRKDISKDVSSFANSDGGIIIYGVKELNHKASSISFIDGNEFSKEWLEQIINSAIQRRIPDLLIFPLRKDGEISQSVYLVKIPKSLEAPHLCRDKRFYKRFNFESVMMEEYEIRQLYGRKVKSKLIIDSWQLIHENSDGDLNQIKLRFEIAVSNIGDVVESSYKINFYFNNLHRSVNINYPQNLSGYDYTRLDNKIIKISSSGLMPIYPDETVNALRFNVLVPINKIEEAFRDQKLNIKLYYLNGEDEMNVDLNEFLDKLIAK
jgi:Putative DNA-binding domain